MKKRIFDFFEIHGDLILTVLILMSYFTTQQRAPEYLGHVSIIIAVLIPVYYFSTISLIVVNMYEKYKPQFYLVNVALVFASKIIATHKINEQLGIELAYIGDSMYVLAVTIYIMIALTLVFAYYILFILKNISFIYLMFVFKVILFPFFRLLIWHPLYIVYMLLMQKSRKHIKSKSDEFIKSSNSKQYKPEVDKLSFIMGISALCFLGLVHTLNYKYSGVFIERMTLYVDGYTASACEFIKPDAISSKEKNSIEFVYIEKNEKQCYKAKTKPIRDPDYLKYIVINRQGIISQHIK